MPITVTLECDECGRKLTPNPHFQWAPWGGLEVKATILRWYVDGKHVLCFEHLDEDLTRKQHQAAMLPVTR